MLNLDLAIDNVLKRNTQFRELACIFRRNLQPNLFNVDERVVDAAEGNVRLEFAELRRFKDEIELLDKRWHHVE